MEVQHIKMKRRRGGTLKEEEMGSRWVERGAPRGTERDFGILYTDIDGVATKGI